MSSSSGRRLAGCPDSPESLIPQGFHLGLLHLQLLLVHVDLLLPIDQAVEEVLVALFPVRLGLPTDPQVDPVPAMSSSRATLSYLGYWFGQDLKFWVTHIESTC